jgi:putative ABC transport system permease protein
VLIVSEIALTLVLMAGAGLMLKSIWLMSSISAKYAPERVLSARLEASNPVGAATKNAKRFLDETIREIESIHGVRSAGSFVTLLAEAMVPPESLASTSPKSLMETTLVTPHYFQATGVQLLAGREFTDQDVEGTPPIAIVNESYIRRYGLATDVSILGREIRSDAVRVRGMKPATVVGVISDFRSRPDSDSVPQIYVPLAQHFLMSSTWLYVRTSGDPLEMAGAVRKIVTRDRAVSVGSIQTLEEEMSTAIAPRRFQTALLTSFAALSLLLAVVGTYGVLSFAMSERTHEIGIRLALGGSRAQVLRMVLVGNGKLVFAGLGLGVFGTLNLNRLLSRLIYGVKLTDPWMLTAVCLLLGTLALLASYMPARRAAQVDPVRALRHE